MELGGIDLYAVMAVTFIIVLALCLAVLVHLRDRETMPPRRVSRWLWCADRAQPAVVDFVEEVRTGMRLRSMERCSLLGTGERCSRSCELARARAPQSAAASPILQ